VCFLLFWATEYSLFGPWLNAFRKDVIASGGARRYDVELVVLLIPDKEARVSRFLSIVMKCETQHLHPFSQARSGPVRENAHRQFRFGGDSMTLRTLTWVFLAALSATYFLQNARQSVAQSNVEAASYDAQLRALGEKLRHDTRNERNAFVFIYDDERAARHRLAAFSGKLTKAELIHHDRHQVAKYFRNANTGFHELDLTPKGLDGPGSKVKY
jgi:hypothetical protein